MSRKRILVSVGLAVIVLTAGIGIVSGTGADAQVVGGIGYATGNLSGGEAIGMAAAGASGGAVGGAYIGSVSAPGPGTVGGAAIGAAGGGAFGA